MISGRAVSNVWDGDKDIAGLREYIDRSVFVQRFLLHIVTAEKWQDDKFLTFCFSELRGIESQCDVGFLTLLEKFRYCSVGDSLKRPK